MSKQIWKPGALLSPLPPILVTCGTMEQPNVLTVAWTGIINTQPAMTYISVRPERYSYPMIRSSGEFVLNLTTANLVRAADYCGVRTGAKTNKFNDCKITPAPASTVCAPILQESPMNLECKVTQIIELGSHHMFLAEIQAIQVDESLLDEKGALNLQRANLAAYAHGSYFELGKKIGTFGYSVKKKKKRTK